MQEINRKVGETIRIGNDIQLTILDIDDSQIRIGLSDLTGKAQLRELLRDEDYEEPDHYPTAPLISGNQLTGS